MEERCQQFQADAQALSKDERRRPKEIDRLRKFLHKNQDHRFTDREASHLFQAVQCHVTAALALPPAAPGALGAEEEDPPALGLLEDALKMPFTVFSTGQKKSMLKWLERLRSPGGGTEAKGGGATGPAATWAVLDAGPTPGSFSVMDDAGEERVVRAGPVLAAQLQAALEAGDPVSVRLDPGGDQVALVVTG